MSTTPASTPAPLPAPTGPAVVPGSATTTATSTAPAAPLTDAQLISTMELLVSLLQQIVALQAAQAGAAAVQGGGAAPGATPGFGPLSNSSPVTGGFVLSPAIQPANPLITGSVPGFLPSVGDVTGGGGGFLGNTTATPVTAPLVGTGFSNGFVLSPGAEAQGIQYSALPPATAAAPLPAAGTPAVAGATGGGAAAAPAAAPQVDMRRVLGTPRSGDVVDTILRSATGVASSAKSEGQYIVIQDAGGAQVQAHVHGAWSSHPSRIQEGIQRGFIQVHVHEDGTLHLHDVV